MTVTAATLKARWTEFAPTSDTIVDAAIAEATRLCDVAVYGAAYDDAVMYLACHLLAISPQGAASRLDGGSAPSSPSSSATADLWRTTYGASLLRLMRSRAGGAWCVGAWGL